MQNLYNIISTEIFSVTGSDETFIAKDMSICLKILLATTTFLKLRVFFIQLTASVIVSHRFNHGALMGL